MDLWLGGRAALVTGATCDVGREIALTLAGEGPAVAANYNTSAAEAEAVPKIRASGGTATGRARMQNAGYHAATQLSHAFFACACIFLQESQPHLMINLRKFKYRYASNPAFSGIELGAELAVPRDREPVNDVVALRFDRGVAKIALRPASIRRSMLLDICKILSDHLN